MAASRILEEPLFPYKSPTLFSETPPRGECAPIKVLITCVTERSGKQFVQIQRARKTPLKSHIFVSENPPRGECAPIKVLLLLLKKGALGRVS